MKLFVNHGTLWRRFSPEPREEFMNAWTSEGIAWYYTGVGAKTL